MYYTEKGPFVEELGNTYDAWLSIVGSGDYTSDTKKMAVSIKVNENIYENVIPRYSSDGRVWIYEPTSEIQIAVSPSSGRVMSSLSSLDGVSFVTISKEDRVHKIPDKYYSRRFVITITGVNPDNRTFTTDKTYDEIVDAYNNGEPVVLCMGGDELPLCHYRDDTGFIFIATPYVGNDLTNIIGIEVRITPDKNTIDSSRRTTLGEMSGVSANQIPIIIEVSGGRPTRFGAIDVPKMDYSLALTSCSPGQILVVKTVDSDGKPLTWEAKNISDLVA